MQGFRVIKESTSVECVKIKPPRNCWTMHWSTFKWCPASWSSRRWGKLLVMCLKVLWYGILSDFLNDWVNFIWNWIREDGNRSDSGVPERIMISTMTANLRRIWNFARDKLRRLKKRQKNDANRDKLGGHKKLLFKMVKEKALSLRNNKKVYELG